MRCACLGTDLYMGTTFSSVLALHFKLWGKGGGFVFAVDGRGVLETEWCQVDMTRVRSG